MYYVQELDSGILQDILRTQDSLVSMKRFLMDVSFAAVSRTTIRLDVSMYMLHVVSTYCHSGHGSRKKFSPQ